MEDRNLYVGTREGVGDTFNNHDGGRVFKCELPEYMQFSFNFSETWNLSMAPLDILSGDFDNDGLDDIVSMTNSGNNYWANYVWNIKINNGNNTFINESSFPLTAQNSDFVFSGDFNGDGYEDIGVNRISDPNSVNSGEWIVFFNNGDTDNNPNTTPNFSFSPLNSQRISWGMQPDKITTGDFDGNGYDDLAIYKESEGWYFRLNNFDSTNQTLEFHPTPILYSWVTNADFIFAEDINGDGYDDIGIVNNNLMSEWIVRFNDIKENGNITFSQEKNYQNNTVPDFITSGKYNSDGLGDIGIYKNQQNGNWTFEKNYGYYFDNINN